MKQVSIPDTGYEVIISCSNVIGKKSQKYAGKGCYPPPSPVKKQVVGHVSGYLCKW